LENIKESFTVSYFQPGVFLFYFLFGFVLRLDHKDHHEDKGGETEDAEDIKLYFGASSEQVLLCNRKQHDYNGICDPAARYC
jgi:hypothetical protein